MSFTTEMNEEILSYVDEIRNLKYKLALQDNELLREENKQLKDEMAKMREKSNLARFENSTRLADLEDEIAHTKEENLQLSRKNKKLKKKLKKLTKQNMTLNVEESEMEEYEDWKRLLDDEAPCDILSSTIELSIEPANVIIPLNDTTCRNQPSQLIGSRNIAADSNTYLVNNKLKIQNQLVAEEMTTRKAQRKPMLAEYLANISRAVFDFYTTIKTLYL